MVGSHGNRAWMWTITIVFLGFEAVLIPTICLPATGFIVLIVAYGTSAPLDTLDWAIMLYPLTWLATAFGAYRLKIAERHRLSFACVLIPVAHIAAAAACVMVALNQPK